MKLLKVLQYHAVHSNVDQKVPCQMVDFTETAGIRVVLLLSDESSKTLCKPYV